MNVTDKERFLEITKHLCSDTFPSVYLNDLLEAGAFAQYPFSMLPAMRNTPQSPTHHPEGNVWNHTCLVVDEAAQLRKKSQNPTAFMWAALLHDIGKPGTTRKRRGRITSYDHEKLGMDLAVEFLAALTDDQALIQRVATLIRYHMQPLFVIKDLPFAEVEAMKREIDVREIALLGYCDRMGRTNSDAKAEGVHMRQFLKKCGVNELR
jgi:putative nucleotidyltransferase with HDIG domain